MSESASAWVVAARAARRAMVLLCDPPNVGRTFRVEGTGGELYILADDEPALEGGKVLLAKVRGDRSVESLTHDFYPLAMRCPLAGKMKPSTSPPPRGVHEGAGSPFVGAKRP